MIGLRALKGSTVWRGRVAVSDLVVPAAAVAGLAAGVAGAFVVAVAASRMMQNPPLDTPMGRIEEWAGRHTKSLARGARAAMAITAVATVAFVVAIASSPPGQTPGLLPGPCASGVDACTSGEPTTDSGTTTASPLTTVASSIAPSTPSSSSPSSSTPSLSIAPSPSPAPPSPVTGTVDLAGEIATDLPGTLVAPGATVTSRLDLKRRPAEYYAIELAAGQTLHVDVEAQCCYQALSIAYPDQGFGLASQAEWTTLFGPWLASESGAYTVRVQDGTQGEGAYEYTVRFVVTGTPDRADPPASTPVTGSVDLSGWVAAELPGTRIGSGTRVTSRLDLKRRPAEFYAVELEAGQTLHVEIEASCCYQSLGIAYPGDADGVASDALWTSLGGPFLASESGTYTIRVGDATQGQGAYQYTIHVVVTG